MTVKARSQLALTFGPGGRLEHTAALCESSRPRARGLLAPELLSRARIAVSHQRCSPEVAVRLELPREKLRLTCVTLACRYIDCQLNLRSYSSPLRTSLSIFSNKLCGTELVDSRIIFQKLIVEVM